MIYSNLGINAAGHLTFGGQDTAALAEKYGTPLYLMDEARIRRNCRIYTQAFRAHFGDNALPLYAGKAASFKHIYTLVREEGLGIDVVSPGEIQTAFLAGFPLENAYFHGNNKTDADIAFAMERGVGYFVVDGPDELAAVDRIAGRRGARQKILLRLTPGIDPHTYDAVNTGMVDSKFGTAIETGQALPLAEAALALPSVSLEGFHCHVGSQVFEEDVFQRASLIMLRFFARLRDRTGYVTRQFDIGGGYGVPYVESDGAVDVAARIGEVARAMKAEAAALGIPLPKILMEPGRSIVADAGLTLYTAGAVKEIPGYKNYVSVDGGMTDNPRYALYGSKYTVYAAGRMNERADFLCDLVGRCCESGDIIQPRVTLPKPRRGDLIAVCGTGAYNYS
ncbi:MAG TPA: diaminopimelate decarboxylase, partial [Oscillospiraceae bacterium]|nr:diaminopimelate decarboxylase [Oscillospiraceae bacterium]